MGRRRRGRIPFIFWPFVALWRLVAFVVCTAGRLVALLLGLVLLAAGLALSATLIGAVVGTPLILVGAMLVLRAVF